MVSSWHNKPHSPENEIKSSEDGLQLPTWPGSLKMVAHAILALTLWTVPVLVHVRVWVHIQGDKYLCVKCNPRVAQILNAAILVLKRANQNTQEVKKNAI